VIDRRICAGVAFFASAIRYAPHTPDGREAGVLSRMIPSASDWPLALYDRAMSRIAFGTVSTPNGPLDVYRQRGAIVVFSGLDQRSSAFHERLTGQLPA